ncbi:hypothetical protein ACP70R_043486 [Stipagrostis hirtigluma subsp. patula]
MAMSDTAGSSFPQWAALYHHEPSPVPAISRGHGVAAGAAAADYSGTLAGGGAASPTSGGSGGSPTRSQAQQQAGIEGPRAGKPARRRSRASRRAPVTLLNTDAANFRAMVQQFTGIPAPPAAPAGAPFISFAGDYGFPPPAPVMSFDHLHRSHPPQDQLFRTPPQQQYTGGATFGYNALHGAGDVFASAEDRMLLQSMQAAQMPHLPPASAVNSSSGNGYFA